MSTARGPLLPLEGAPPLLTPTPLDGAVRHAAVRAVLRRAGSDEDAARTVLTALGLIPDPLHKPTRWSRN